MSYYSDDLEINFEKSKPVHFIFSQSNNSYIKFEKSKPIHFIFQQINGLDFIFELTTLGDN